MGCFNPPTGKIGVQIQNKESSFFMEEVVITNKLGRIIFHEKFKSKTKAADIKVQVPMTDIYFLKAFDGTKWHTTKISLVK